MVKVALAEDAAQFEQHRRSRQLVARYLVARDVGKRDVIARREQGFEKHVEILLAPIDVAGLATVRAQIEFVAAGGPRERVLPQPEHEHGAEWDRAHGHERSHGHAARQVVATARRRGCQRALGQFSGHAVRNWLIAEACVCKILQLGKKAGDDGPARDIVLVEYEIRFD